MFERKREQSDFNAEVEAHVKLEADRLRGEGLSEEEALLAARRAFGNITRAQERFYESGRWAWWDHLGQDLRFGVRALRKNPGFATVAVLTLALGIGANSAIFSLIDAVLLRPLPYADAQRLVLIKEKLALLSAEPVDVPAPDVVDFQRQSRAFSGVAGFQSTHIELSGAGQPARVLATRVTSELFPLLGVAPAVGRTFTKAEDRPGSLLAVLSYGLWQSRWAGRPDVVGKTVDLDRKPYLVIGVMPPGFEFPLDRAAGQADLWVPMGFTPDELSDFGDNFDYGLIARLKPGVTAARADADVQSVAYGILQTYPASMRNELNLSAVTIPLREAVTGQVKTLLWILFGAVGFVLLIACANVANLLLAKSVGRQKEIAVRAALGAGRGRLARQFIAESLLLGLTGGAGGLMLAAWSARLLVALRPAGLPLAGSIGLDIRVLAFTLAVSVLTGVLFGTAPALASYSANLNVALRESARSTTQSRGHHRMRSALVTAETALALVLMIGAGLLVRTFARLRSTDPGFEPAHLLTMALDLPGAKYQRGQDVLAFYQGLMDRLRQLPGVQSAAAGTSFPMVSTNWNHIFTPEGYQPGARERAPLSWHTLVLGDYFQTLQIPLIRGRYFTAQDRAGSLPVVIVSAALARRYWPGQDPVGKRLKWGPPQSGDKWLTVVGVVGDVKLQELGEQMTLHTYEPYLQLPQVWSVGLGRALDIAVRAPADPAGLFSALRASVWGLDRELAISHLETGDEAIGQSLAPQRFNLILIGAFALLALALGSVGLYAVISVSVTQRAHEVGIRMALGARGGEVLRLVVGQGLKLTLLGVGLGVAGALALTRFLASLLYGVRPTDPATFAAVCLLIVAVALAASYIPARRATRVDPIVALRCE
ncbi:MAG TPA: ABC transporter permease [Terriglobia bacterium]|nr:ABC transporter permease [Terriglobia bacterium]